MYELNDNFFKFPGGYLFTMVREKKAKYEQEHPEKDVISLGVGDVTQPLAPVVVEAMQKAVAELGVKETFRGYGSSIGYEFLRKKIQEWDFERYGAKVELDEIFINDGAKSDVGNIIELFSNNNYLAICEPTYPAYVDTNVIAGRAGTYDSATNRWSNILYMACTEENGFLPQIPEKTEKTPALIYLCFPNNPTGAMITKEELQKWVDYARENQAIILYDAAYVAFIETPGAPHTIYECEGARKCAIEMRSYSKTAGFTGQRLGYTVVPKEIQNEKGNLNKMWNRRQGTKYNGAPYIIQRGAEAIYSVEGEKQIKEQIAYYKRNTKLIRDELAKMGYTAYGGVDAPYVWMKTPEGMTSWEFFDYLLENANIIGTPGSGFGPSGEGFFRLTGFGSYESTIEALNRFHRL
ncbi:MAG: LL-diaminopimelate aminotransferase [Acetatifactor sp.]